MVSGKQWGGWKRLLLTRRNADVMFVSGGTDGGYAH
jgi:hypothetical protein